MKCKLLYSKTRNESGSKFKIFGKSRDLKMPSLKSRNKHAAKISCNEVINVIPYLGQLGTCHWQQAALQ